MSIVIVVFLKIFNLPTEHMYLPPPICCARCKKLVIPLTLNSKFQGKGYIYIVKNLSAC